MQNYKFRSHGTVLRLCKQLAESAWAVACSGRFGVFIGGLQMDQCLATNTKCRRLPSGRVLQDTPNACKRNISGFYG
jgi:homeobox-leucine zipper protein